ncbi:unnamed protein product [Rhizophagus irregularis]|nr:unnamed protein product [Rhizophagus irregularis]CAB5384419.1 unnamed protein product [Rhizophagus irregularis]
MNYIIHFFLLDLLVFFIPGTFAYCYNNTGSCKCITNDTIGGFKCGSELNNGCSDFSSIFRCNPGDTKICRYGTCTLGCCATGDGNSYCCKDYACTGCKKISKLSHLLQSQSPQPPQPSQPHPLTTNCSRPSLNSCNFYTDCLEKKFNCGINGYPIRYGSMNCEKFANAINRFSNDGKKWVTKTMLCLQNALVPVYNNNTITCAEIKSAAFSSHSKCYIDSGLCSIPADWLKIFQIIDIRDIVESWEVIMQVVQTAEGCAAFYVWLIESFCKEHHYCKE